MQAQPELTLRAIQSALAAAAEADDARKIAHLLLQHAYQVQRITQESPLQALRAGKSIEAVWTLADQFDNERRVLWYLLVAWELKERGGLDEARATLERLQKKSLPHLSNWQSKYACYILAHLPEVSLEAFTTVKDQILDDAGNRDLCVYLTNRGQFDLALKTAQAIERVESRALALGAIAGALAQAGEFDLALQTAQAIEDEEEQAEALRVIAEALAQAGQFDRALQTAQKIKGGVERARALRSIAEAQARVGEVQSARETFTLALQTAQQIEDEAKRAEALGAIAESQVKAGFSEQAVRTAGLILTKRNEHLPEIASALVEAGDKEHFKQLLIPCAYYIDSAYEMCGLLARLYPEQAGAIAEVVMQAR